MSCYFKQVVDIIMSLSQISSNSSNKDLKENKIIYLSYFYISVKFLNKALLNFQFEEAVSRPEGFVNSLSGVS